MTTIRLPAGLLEQHPDTPLLPDSLAEQAARMASRPMPSGAATTELDTLYLSTGAAAALLTVVLLFA